MAKEHIIISLNESRKKRHAQEHNKGKLDGMKKKVPLETPSTIRKTCVFRIVELG